MQTDFNRVPLYSQLRDAIVGRIQAGEWRGGQSIPNEGNLAREYGVSPGTMRKTLDLMEFQRFLVRRQGKGTFVREQVDFDSLPEDANDFISAVGGATMHGSALQIASGATYTADGLRKLADGALEVAAWIEKRSPRKNGRGQQAA